MRLLWWFLPEEALPLLILAAGVLVMILGRRAMGFLVPLLLVLLVTPFLEGLMAALPWWLTALILLGLGLALLRSVIALFVGDQATGHLIGALATDVVRFLLRGAVLLPLLMIRLAVRAIFPRKVEVKR